MPVFLSVPFTSNLYPASVVVPNYLVFGQNNLTTYWPIRALSAKFDGGAVDLTSTGSSTINMLASNSAGNQSSIRMANVGQEKWTFGVVQGQNRLMFKYNTATLTSGGTEYVSFMSNGTVRLKDTTDIMTNSGSPEGVQTSRVGSIYMRMDGTTGTALYLKETGTGNTGWVPISSNRVWQGKIAGEADTLTTGVKLTFRMPYACTITGVKGAVNTASSSGNVTIDILEAGTSIMTTNKITIEATETTSLDATQQPVITDNSIAADALMTIDVTAAGTNAIGGEVTIYYRL